MAIALPAVAAGELDSAVAPLRPAWPELRWTGRDAWHLTLAFLGEVDEKLIGRLGTRLERAAARHAPLSLSLGGAGAFPTAARARVLWTGVEGDREGLEMLAKRVAAAARTLAVRHACGVRALTGVVGRVAAFRAKRAFTVRGDQFTACHAFFTGQRRQHKSSPIVPDEVGPWMLPPRYSNAGEFAQQMS